MSILASREHTCVHPYVSLSKNKNDECQKMVDPLRVCLMCVCGLCTCCYVCSRVTSVPTIIVSVGIVLRLTLRLVGWTQLGILKI